MREIILQTYYWNQPKCDFWEDSSQVNLWTKLRYRLDYFKGIGINSLYLPPPYKGLKGQESNGFDVHDHFDLGEFKQDNLLQDNDIKSTKYGTREELEELIKKAHEKGFKIYTDLITTRRPVETKSDVNLEEFENDEEKYLFWADWLLNNFNFDGFRIDASKETSRTVIKKLRQQHQDIILFHEYWSGNASEINHFLANLGGDHLVVDFPLFYKLKDICDNHWFDMRNFDNTGVLNSINGNKAMLFAENHDTDAFDSIVNNKFKAYAYILFHNNPIRLFAKDLFVYSMEDGILDILEFTKDLPNAEKRLIKAERNYIFLKRENYYLVLSNDFEDIDIDYEFEKEVEYMGDGFVQKNKLKINSNGYLLVKEVQ